MARIGIAATLAVACSYLAFAANATVKVDGGALSGAVEDGVRVFKGIPFAAPPIGDLRWKPPQPPAAWSGVRSATEFSAACQQLPYPPTSIYYSPPRPMSEDCLYLNVWTAAAANETRPVMVWIHGGALTRGTGATDTYDGAALAKKGVVLVTINYRLGPFGYLAHHDLTAESAHHASGNYGVLDQIAALTWVRTNIAAFGGDPSRVTIFGESAGSWSVNVLQATPLARGLFHRAIGESGAQFGRNTHLKEAEERGAAFAAAAGAGSLTALRALAADRILAVQAPSGGVNVDGWVLPDDVQHLFAQKQQSDVPVIAGSNGNEMTTLTAQATWPTTLDDYRRRLRAQFGDGAADAEALYPAKSDAEAAGAFLGIGRDTMFTLQMRTWARMNTKNAYLYQFTHVPPVVNHERLKAYHASEIVYAFNNVVRRPWHTDADLTLADQMSSYWTNFAKTGDPNGAGLPAWTAYDPADEAYLDFGDTPAVKHHLLKAQLDFLARGPRASDR
jgi:para-nitrobenzyl esterase